MVNLNKKQLEFLKNELNLTKEDIEKMSEDEWEDVREKCFEIETDELLDMDCAGKDVDRDEWTERCNLAVSIVDIEFSVLGNPA